MPRTKAPVCIKQHIVSRDRKLHLQSWAREHYIPALNIPAKLNNRRNSVVIWARLTFAKIHDTNAVVERLHFLFITNFTGKLPESRNSHAPGIQCYWHSLRLVRIVTPVAEHWYEATFVRAFWLVIKSTMGLLQQVPVQHLRISWNDTAELSGFPNHVNCTVSLYMYASSDKSLRLISNLRQPIKLTCFIVVVAQCKAAIWLLFFSVTVCLYLTFQTIQALFSLLWFAFWYPTLYIVFLIFLTWTYICMQHPISETATGIWQLDACCIISTPKQTTVGQMQSPTNLLLFSNGYY